MLVKLLAQTWRSVVSVIIAWILIIFSLLYYPEALAFVIDSARGTRQWLLDLVGARGSDTVDILAGAIITDHTVTMVISVCPYRRADTDPLHHRADFGLQ